jgi:hypothetical protein
LIPYIRCPALFENKVAAKCGLLPLSKGSDIRKIGIMALRIKMLEIEYGKTNGSM